MPVTPGGVTGCVLSGGIIVGSVHAWDANHNTTSNRERTDGRQDFLLC